MELTSADRKAMKDFWEVYEGHYDQVVSATLGAMAENSEFGAVLRAMSPEQLAEQNRVSRELMRRALFDNEWDPYLADLHAQGANYAQTGISFPAWFELLSTFRKYVVPLLAASYGKNPERFAAAVNGMDKFIDTAMSVIGETYLSTKEKLIGQQQEALRELSTPVLQVREGELIVPIIGMIDTQRARQLTEALLRAIRDNRARVVVIDITGVPAVDTKVANHLAQTVEAARLMGAHAIVTGLSAEVAQTLVTLGIDLGKLKTVGDLQGGIDEADRLLGYKVVRMDEDRNMHHG